MIDRELQSVDDTDILIEKLRKSPSYREDTRELFDQYDSQYDYCESRIGHVDYLLQVCELRYRAAKIVAIHPQNIDVKMLLDIYSNLYPHEVSHIDREFFKFEPSDDHIEMLLYGQIQSGKSTMIILSALCYLLSGHDVYVLTRASSCADVNQFIHRFDEFVESEFTHGRPTWTHLVYKTENPTHHPNLFIDMYSAKAALRMQEQIKSRGRSAVLVCDEADLRTTNNHTFSKLVEQCARVLYVTATPQDVLNEQWTVTGANIKVFPPSPNYRGFNTLTICPPISNNFVQQVNQAFNMDNAALAAVDHPVVILYTDKHKICDIHYKFEQLMNAMQDVTVISLTDSKYWIAGAPDILRQTCIRQLHAKVNERGIIHVTPFKCGTISNLFKILQDCGVANLPRIVILAVHRAARGINFSNHGGWHITHQIMTVCANNAATTFQKLRILGNYTDQLPLTLIAPSTVETYLRKVFHLTQEVTGRLSDVTRRGYVIDYTTQLTNISMKTMTVNIDKYPKKFTKCKSLKLVHGDDGGDVYECTDKSVVRSVINDEDDHGWLHIPCGNEQYIAFYNDICNRLRVYRNQWVLRSERGAIPKERDRTIANGYSAPLDKRKLDKMEYGQFINCRRTDIEWTRTQDGKVYYRLQLNEQ